MVFLKQNFIHVAGMYFDRQPIHADKGEYRRSVHDMKEIAVLASADLAMNETVNGITPRMSLIIHGSLVVNIMFMYPMRTCLYTL